MPRYRIKIGNQDFPVSSFEELRKRAAEEYRRGGEGAGWILEGQYYHYFSQQRHKHEMAMGVWHHKPTLFLEWWPDTTMVFEPLARHSLTARLREPTSKITYRPR